MYKIQHLLPYKAISKSMLLILLLFPLHAINAQIIGDEALRQLERGNVSFLEGEFIAFLADTCSPDFVEQSLANLGYEITYSDIHPLTISLVNTPPRETLDDFFQHPDILDYSYEPASFDSLYFKELLNQRKLSEEEYDAAYERIVKSQSIPKTVIRFNYHVTEDSVKIIMRNYRSIAYQITPGNLKSVNIKAEPGTEQEVMEAIEKLPFVDSTALIGVID